MKILIVSLDNVGDTLISLAVYRALRAQPGVETAFWTKEYSRDIIPLAGDGIEHHHCDPFWDRSPGKAKGGLYKYLKTLLAIRGSGYDAAIILHANWRKNLSCLLAGIPRRYALKGAFATDYIKPGEGDTHILDSSRKLVEAALGKDPGELRYPVAPAGFGETPRTATLFSSGTWAVIHPFSGNPRRNLPLDTWTSVLQFLESRNLRVLVNASPAEKEIFNGVSEPGAGRVFSCDLDLDIRNLAFAVSRAALFIGNNSGPLHLASALGTPCLGIFQKSWIKKISPRGKFLPELAVFENDPSEISALEIMAKADKLLSHGPAPL
ncbi:MAG: glycosyltransferase family 9 protein [Elusimicrobiota bacterium]|nr:glycosyltransferase family 9 protein [Elusimicrobiota bacterium]